MKGCNTFFVQLTSLEGTAGDTLIGGTLHGWGKGEEKGCLGGVFMALDPFEEETKAALGFGNILSHDDDFTVIIIVEL